MLFRSAIQETWVRSLGSEDPLEEGMATHSSILAWRMPWTEKWAAVHEVTKSGKCDSPDSRVTAAVETLTNGFTGFPRWRSGKESACQCRTCKRCGFDPWVVKIPWRRKLQPPPVFFPGKFHGQRSLVGYSSPGHKESYMTENTCQRKDFCVEKHKPSETL